MKAYRRQSQTNLRWAPILKRAAEIVRSYATGVTLRQLFYRLVAEQLLPNLQGRYRQLSAYTAKARRAGTFPDLIDQTSRIRRSLFFDSPQEAKSWLADLYRRDRTSGQRWSIYLAVEKMGMEEQLFAALGQERGLPIVALGGYASQTQVDKVRVDIEARERPAVLIYAGDMDPTGEDIDRDFSARVGAFDKVIRVALNESQVASYNLPFNPDPEVMQKLEDDPRSTPFKERHGKLAQYELDALPPDDLMDLYTNAVDGFWDDAAFQRVLRQEAKDKTRL